MSSLEPDVAPPARRPGVYMLAVLLAVAVGVAGGFAIALRGRTQTPGEDSADAGFARDMSAHHAQAVEMATTLTKRTMDPTLQTLATDIALTQQAQIGQMRGWMDQWRVSPTGTKPPLAWAGRSIDRSGMAMNGAMPGMATRDEIKALGQMPLNAAETSFLQLMIRHHRGGVAMARAILRQTSRPEVQRMARSIIASQQSEIGTMTDLLRLRGAPAPMPAPGNMG